VARVDEVVARHAGVIERLVSIACANLPVGACDDLASAVNDLWNYADDWIPEDCDDGRGDDSPEHWRITA
jgi:hypothetical protein